MKKRIALAIAVILALAMVFVLASCGGGNDEGCKGHTYSTEYTTDANGHWYEATCGCQGEVANYGAHKDEDKNGNCDVCQYVLCAHTFADTWSSDENSHYYASTCECDLQKKDEAPHADVNKDGICDVCKYVVCSHEYQSEWSSDENNHWKAASCGCSVAHISLGAHVDSNKDGNCDTCAYVMCAHTYEETWSSDGAYHWHAATCGCDVIKDKAEHNGDENDTECPTCGASICKHTYADTLSFDETYHWYASTCGCDIVKDKTEHTWSDAWEKDGINHWHKTECGCDVISGEEAHFDGDDDDARCDKCGQISFESLIGNIDEYVGEERNGISVSIKERDPINDYNYPSSSTITVYDNYILLEDNYGNKKYISYCGTNNDIPFVVNVDSSNYASREFEFDDSSLLNLAGVADIATGTTLEEYVITLYTLGVGDNGSDFNYTCDEQNSRYTFAYKYDAGYVYVFVEVEFTLDEERMGVTSLTLAEQRYDAESYIEGGNNVVAYTVDQTITQTFGDPCDSTDAPNPHPASKYLLSEFVLYMAEGDAVNGYTPTDVVINDGDTITISPSFANALKLMLGESQAKYADFNRFVVESEMLDISNNIPIVLYANNSGTYNVTISNELNSISITVVVEYAAPSKIKPAIVTDDKKQAVTSYEVYEGIEFVLGAKPDKTYASPYINMPTVTAGDASKITFEKDGENWIVTALAAGKYEITIVSELDGNVKATLPLTVKATPTAADILNGYYEIDDEFGDVSGSIKFIPTEAGADNGTAIFKFKVHGNPIMGVEDEIWETTASYKYENGAIVLTVVEGSDITGFAFSINARHEIVLVRTPDSTNPEFFIEYALVEAVEVIIKEPTQSPFTLEVVETYSYHESNAFTFVAGEAGKYVFFIPKGYGLKVNTKEITSLYNNTSGKEFTYDLKAGQEITFIPYGANVAQFSMYFYIQKKNQMTDANGLGGTYTFTTLSTYELTFKPSASGATTGILTVVDTVNQKNSGDFGYTIVNGDYVFDDGVEIYITKDLGGNWFFQNASMIKEQQFSGPTSYVEPKVEEIPYNGFKDENELGGVYTVEVNGNQYKVIIVPSSDGGKSGIVQIYNPVTDTYCEAYDYTIMFNDYFFNVEDIEIYRDTNGNWLVKCEGIDGEKFADATVIPEPENTTLVIGANTIKINPKDKANGGKEYTLTMSDKGEITFSGANLTVSVYNGDTLVGSTNKIVLEKGVTYTVVINTTAEPGEYTLNISFVKYSDGSEEPDLPTDEWD